MNGITADTLVTWIKTNSVFSALVEEAESQAEINFTSVVATAAKEGDWKAAVEWLKRRRRAEWGDNVQHEVEVRDTSHIASTLDSKLAGLAARIAEAAVPSETEH